VFLGRGEKCRVVDVFYGWPLVSSSMLFQLFINLKTLCCVVRFFYSFRSKCSRPVNMA